MADKHNLPIEIHEHFRKANILHGYVTTEMGEACQHALETGHELLAAKSSIPHGGWEDECKRLFSGSASSARFYMQFARNMEALPKRQHSAVLFLEGSIEGAAKAAAKARKAAVSPKPPKPEPVDTIDVDSQPATPAQVQEAVASAAEDDEPVDLGKCPVCAKSKWKEVDGGWNCADAKCQHPHGEPAGDVDEDRIKIQRQKTQKTGEALMRAFDDLQTMKARPEHEEAIRLCKHLIQMAKGWK